MATQVATTIEKVQPAYVLEQIVQTILPTAEYVARVIFLAKDERELDELLARYAAGKTDRRIVEQLPPDEVYEDASEIKIIWRALTDPNGRNIAGRFGEYRWGVA